MRGYDSQENNINTTPSKYYPLYKWSEAWVRSPILMVAVLFTINSAIVNCTFNMKVASRPSRTPRKNEPCSSFRRLASRSKTTLG